QEEEELTEKRTLRTWKWRTEERRASEEEEKRGTFTDQQGKGEGMGFEWLNRMERGTQATDSTEEEAIVDDESWTEEWWLPPAHVEMPDTTQETCGYYSK
ncbi:hypothetical protein NDU88_006229, partial [Pleurodeles waltl]